MSIIDDISAELQAGKSKAVKSLVSQALEEGFSADVILNDGLMAGMAVVAEKFKNNEIFVPEVLVAARAMNGGISLLEPYTVSGTRSAGKVIIGTVEGDMHDIGKNLVRMMMQGKGLAVIDLGTNVPAQSFIDAAIEQDARIICCSALLTTTMDVMGDVVKAAEASGIRDKVKIMIGGAPVTQDFCVRIGADCYTPNAAAAADAAAEFCAEA